MSIDFPNISSANIYTHLWTVHIICARNIARVLSRFPSARAQLSSQLQRLISKDVVLQLSRLILRSMDFLMSESFKLSGASSAFLPLYTAIAVLKDEGRGNRDLHHWQQHTLEMSRKRGYQFLFKEIL